MEADLMSQLVALYVTFITSIAFGFCTFRLVSAPAVRFVITDTCSISVHDIHFFSLEGCTLTCIMNAFSSTTTKLVSCICLLLFPGPALPVSQLDHCLRRQSRRETKILKKKGL